MDATSGTSITTIASAATAAAVAAGAYLNARLSISTDLRQLRYDRDWVVRLGKRIQELGGLCTMYGMFDRVDLKMDALWFEGRTWTYGQLKNEVNRFAAFLNANGIKQGDYIAVFTTNSPEMIITILALSKLGAIAALVNINLRDDTLQHCLNVSTAQTIISTLDLAKFVPESLTHYTLNLFSFDQAPPPAESVTLVTLESLPLPSVPSPTARATPRDVTCLIYTSGTTGKPKACAVRNQQGLVTSNPLSQDVENPSKYYPLRTYSPLPLFHGTALFTGLYYSLGNSGCLCLSRKFSASKFWKEVKESRATRILYVGELCRYLVSSPPSPFDRDHNCIVAAGNGLRGEIWEKFRKRFGVPEIREFYRSTEGLAKYDNFGCGAWGAGKVGFAGPIRRFYETDTILLKTDPATGELYRDPKTGFCKKANLGEPGEVVGRVKDRALLTEYLNNASATEEKLLHDVFEKGDCWQRMGDLLVMDKSGWVQFHDRIGDTFRWKGENVSAGEVRDHIAKLSGVQDAVVYGVKLAGYDGQAGAASLTLESVTDESFMKELYAGLKKTGLPNYAMPRLVRITPEIEANATFKKAKGDIVKKSWKPDENKDKLYWLNGTNYEKLDTLNWSEIESGRAKL
ncbi:putative bifunctional fatty acid transporter/acyl-CoA synthetase [Xylogone sp. PMI_703]|nr:putative bifunctional fatty acid transporter/acyl-CoA synthetase [Xylogone sp. PMI_703]